MKKLRVINFRSKWTWTTFLFLSFFTMFVLTDCETPIDAGESDFVINDAGHIQDAVFLTPTAWQVPHDVSSTTPSQKELAIFAWKEFIALNWPSNYNTTTHSRGKPDTTKTVRDFLNAGLHPDLLVVWETYKHRIEVFPLDTTGYQKHFDAAPQYSYTVEGQDAIASLNDPQAPKVRNVRNIFNNLDETSEINLATLFVSGDPNAPGASNYPNPDTASFLPGAPRRIIYEAKANEVFFNYAIENELYNTDLKNKRINQTAVKIQGRGADTLGAKCLDTLTSIISFPCGVTGEGEGSIEVKASWRRLTRTEANSGRYFTAPVLYYRKGNPSNPNDTTTIYYEVIPATANENSLPFGLVGLHIIHKTKNIPSYIFATFEQVDNLKRKQENNDLFLFNRNKNLQVYSGVQQVAQRDNAILPITESVNALAHAEFRAVNPNTIWQYYQLIGVQGAPSSEQDNDNFFLANIVTETNEVLQKFSGTLNNNGTKNPHNTNLRVGAHTSVTGGCKGCHGNAQDADFSFITKNGPFNQDNIKYSPPDVVNQPLLKDN